MNNKSGKTLIIFLSLILVVLVSGTAISLFMLQKETQEREAAQEQIALLEASQKKLNTELDDTKKQMYILQEKNKEADEKINNLLDDLELEEGLREQLKQENVKLKAALEEEAVNQKKLKETMSAELQEKESKIVEIQKQIDALMADKNIISGELEKVKKGKIDLESKIDLLEKEKSEALKQVEEQKKKLEELKSGKVSPTTNITPQAILPEEQSILRPNKEPAMQELVAQTKEVNLDPIVIGETPKGRVLSVDKQTEFLIFNLGLKDGVELGQVVGVYRGEMFLGDVKVSRVQEEMAAADFIPPFSSKKARKNDLVILRP